MPKKWISEESMRTAEKFFLNPYPVPLDEALAHGQSLLAWIDQQDKEIWSKRDILQFYKGQKAQLLAPLKARLWDLMAKFRASREENERLRQDMESNEALMDDLRSRYCHAINELERYREEAEGLRVKLAAVEDALSQAVFAKFKADKLRSELKNRKYHFTVNSQDWDEAPPPPTENLEGW